MLRVTQTKQQTNSFGLTPIMPTARLAYYKPHTPAGTGPLKVAYIFRKHDVLEDCACSYIVVTHKMFDHPIRVTYKNWLEFKAVGYEVTQGLKREELRTEGRIKRMRDRKSDGITRYLLGTHKFCLSGRNGGSNGEVLTCYSLIDCYDTALTKTGIYDPQAVNTRTNTHSRPQQSYRGDVWGVYHNVCGVKVSAHFVALCDAIDYYKYITSQATASPA